MDFFGPWHIIIVACVFVMLFGAKRLPEAARSLGKSARILKTEIKSLHDDDTHPRPPAEVTAGLVGPSPAPLHRNDHEPAEVSARS